MNDEIICFINNFCFHEHTNNVKWWFLGPSRKGKCYADKYYANKYYANKLLDFINYLNVAGHQSATDHRETSSCNS